MDRNINARNFGLRSSNMGRALETAYRLKTGNGDNTKNQTSPLHKFAKYIKEELDIKDLRNVEREHVLSYAEHLNEQYEKGELSAGSAQVYLSRVNVALEFARNDLQCHVDPVREASLPKRSGIAQFDCSASLQLHYEAKARISERLAMQLEMQRIMALRFKESCLINPRKVLSYAKTTGIIRITDGTKGGRPREFPANNDIILVLNQAVKLQQNEKSMIPEGLTWRQYQNQCYREITQTGLNFHSERHSYANNRYSDLSGVESPVRAGIPHGVEHFKYIAEKLKISIPEAKERDQDWRLQISKELGHSRISITNHYLG